VSPALAHPEWLAPLAVLLAAVATALVATTAWTRRRIRRLGDAGPRRLRAGGGRDAALWLALTAVAAALVGPLWLRETVPVSTAGTDVVVLVDLSRSMTARDVPPSRLDRALRAAGDVLERLAPESRAALAGFAGRGVLFTPLSPDKRALREMLAALGPELLRPGGSDLEAGVEAALRAFDGAGRRPRALLVLSDGELTAGASDGGASRAARRDVRVVSVALGREEGAVVPDHGQPLRDGRGEVVRSRRRTAPLARLAAGTGGRPFEADVWGHVDPAALVDEVERFTRGGGEDGFVLRELPVAAVAPFALLAFLLLALEAAWPRPGTGPPRTVPGPSAPHRRRRATALTLVLALAGVPGPGPARAQGPGASEAQEAAEAGRTAARLEARGALQRLSAEELLALGVARAQAGRPAAAERAFEAAALRARDPGTAARAYHDLGVAALEREALRTARDRFFDALALDPGLEPSRFNLEWTLAALSADPPEPPSAQPGEEGDRPLPSEPRPEEPEEEPSGRPQPDTRPEEAEPPSEDDGEAERRASRPPLSEEARRRWLDQVEDDPGRALRSAASGDRERRRRERGRPTW